MTSHTPSPEDKFLIGLGKGRWSSYLLAFYFVGMIGSGIAGLFVRPVSASDVFTDNAWLTLDYSLIAVGTAGLSASIFKSRMGEFYAVIGISCLTIVNAVVVLQANPQTAIRLLFAPCMMIPYAWMRLGFNMSRNEMVVITQVVTAERDMAINQGVTSDDVDDRLD